jgi:CBS-domain-containing membrane protein
MKEIPGYLDITPADLKDVYSHAYRHALDRIANSVRARDLMTRDVLTVKRETPLRDVAGILANNEISGVPCCIA